ncbi:hypothetical protein [Egicoccus halophilus]|uniref:HEAT repeat n=1 Tax=Egicoccus halophilus TaxID=1670830 RepID=A0A8J3ADN1_9ACTN|nr:hypothetical protein [Egicoccus halophilus]GGI06186.1 hypothetical protein GCM10011354_17830 [Egicoccus halophilus]
MELIDVVLVATLLLLAVVLLGALDLVLGTWRRRRHGGRRREAERDLLAVVVDALAGADHLDGARRAIREAEPAVAEQVCLAAGRIVGEEERALLAELAAAADVNQRARRELRSRHWWRRLRAVRLLHVASDDPADLQVLADPHPEVRAAALLWLSDRPRQLGERPVVLPPRRPSRDATELLADALVSDAALVRVAAKHVCVKADPPPLAVLERALELARRPETHPLAAVAPLTTIAALGGSVPLSFDDFLASDAAPVRAAAIRAVAATAPEQTALLARRHLADEQVVRIAVADVAGRDPAAGALLLALAEDPAWQVRQVARRTLVRSGPVGRALLRRLQQAVA